MLPAYVPMVEAVTCTWKHPASSILGVTFSISSRTSGHSLARNLISGNRWCGLNPMDCLHPLVPLYPFPLEQPMTPPNHAKPASNYPSMAPTQDLCPPQQSEMSSIAQTQEKKEHEILKKYKNTESLKDEDFDRKQSEAARTLQKNYRGYRARRELRGLSLDPSSRWVEVSTTLAYGCHPVRFPNIHRQSKKPNTESSRRLVHDPQDQTTLPELNPKLVPTGLAWVKSPEEQAVARTLPSPPRTKPTMTNHMPRKKKPGDGKSGLKSKSGISQRNRWTCHIF